MTEQEIRDRYGISPEAYLPRSAVDLHGLAALLYAAWRSFECKRQMSPGDEFPPPQFFHVATELCSMARRGTFQSAEHILWPKAVQDAIGGVENCVEPTQTVKPQEQFPKEPPTGYKFYREVTTTDLAMYEETKRDHPSVTLQEFLEMLEAFGG